MIYLISKWYFLIFLLSMILIVVIIFYIQHILRRRTVYEKDLYIGEKNEKHQKKVKKIIEREALMWNFVFFLFIAVLGGWHINYNFTVKDKFSWKEKGGGDINKLFSEEKRKENYFVEVMQSAPHESLTQVLYIKNGVVDESVLTEYIEDIKSTFGIVPFCEDVKNEENASELFEDNLIVFSEYVGLDKQDKASIDLWEAYLAGEEVIKVNHTSENVFQTAVLAEAAQANEYKNSIPSDKTEEYMLGAIEKFEEFLTFIDRNAGNGFQVDPAVVCFRVGKMIYRESRNSNLNDPQKKLHYVLLAYSCFHFSVNQVDKDNEDYLCYLYYYGESTLNILNHIEEKELRATICNEQIEMWEHLDDNYFTDHRVETKSSEDVKMIVEMLKGYIE